MKATHKNPELSSEFDGYPFSQIDYIVDVILLIF